MSEMGQGRRSRAAVRGVSLAPESRPTASSIDHLFSANCRHPADDSFRRHWSGWERAGASPAAAIGLTRRNTCSSRVEAFSSVATGECAPGPTSARLNFAAFKPWSRRHSDAAMSYRKCPLPRPQHAPPATRGPRPGSALAAEHPPRTARPLGRRRRKRSIAEAF